MLLLVEAVTLAVLFSWVNMLARGLVCAFRGGAGGAMFCHKNINDNVSMLANVCMNLQSSARSNILQDENKSNLSSCSSHDILKIRGYINVNIKLQHTCLYMALEVFISAS